MHKHSYVFKTLSIDQIEQDMNQPRKDFGTSGDANRLLVSIREYGIEQPLAVTETENGRYIIIDGHRRYRCSKKLKLQEVPCRVYPKLSNAELETRRFEMQNNRRSWRPMERSTALHRIKTEGGFKSINELARHLGMTQSLVASSLQLKDQVLNHVSLIERYNLSESYSLEFVRLKPKLRKIGDHEVDDIIINLFERVEHKVIRNAKDFRKLGRIFKRATANQAEILRFLDNPDMTVYELEQRTLQSGFSLHIEELMREIAKKRQEGVAFSSQEKSFIGQLKELLVKVT